MFDWKAHCSKADNQLWLVGPPLDVVYVLVTCFQSRAKTRFHFDEHSVHGSDDALAGIQWIHLAPLAQWYSGTAEQWLSPNPRHSSPKWLTVKLLSNWALCTILLRIFLPLH